MYPERSVRDLSGTNTQGSDAGYERLEQTLSGGVHTAAMRSQSRPRLPTLRIVLAALVALGAAAVSSTALAGASAPYARNGMLAYTAHQKALQVFSISPDGSGTRRVSTSDAVEFLPVLSPDATRLAFVSQQDGNAEIYVSNADGSGATRVTSHPATDVTGAWSPDSRRLAFASDRDGNAELYVVELESLATTRVTRSAGDDYFPAWSPDGTRIAFTSDRDGDDEVYVMNADGTGVTQLTSTPSDDDDGLPAWSPDGTRIAFTSDRDGDDEIYVMNADGTGVSRVTRNEDDDWWPAWSPDGTQIAFTSDADDHGDLFELTSDIVVVAVDGSGRRRLTTTSGTFDVFPSWGADGRIRFTSDRAADVALEIANVDGSGRRTLAASPAEEGLGRWSPDGTRIAFVSFRGGDGEISVVSAAGGKPRQLTRNRQEDVFPTWSPDGKRIAFIREGKAGGLYVMSASGSGQRSVLFFEKDSDACCAAWSPDGTRIALVLDRAVVVATADGGRVQKIAARGCGSLSWSPDSRRIVFDLCRGGNWDLFVVPARGGAATRLTRTSSDEEWPDWSPDGRLLAFSSSSDELSLWPWDSAIFVMSASGGAATQVRLPVPAAFPDWQPLR